MVTSAASSLALSLSMAACAEFSAISSTIASTSSTSRCALKDPPPTTLPGALQFNGLRISTPLSNTSLLRCLGRSGKYCLSAGRRGLLPVAATCSTSGSVIVIVSFEVAPWSKTGGLGDVIGGLAPALAARGNRVMTVAPRHDQYKDAWDTNVSCELLVGDEKQHVRYFHTYKRGVDRVFVDHPSFLEKVWGKTESKVYGPVAGSDYKDNQLRFSLFAQAAIEAARVLNLNCGEHKGPYGEDVIFVANDWHTALLPCYLKACYQSKGLFVNAKVAFCIHNIAYQGRFAPQDFSLLNLPDSFRSSFDFFDGHDVPVKGWKINWMKAGMVNAHIVLTVSPNYALEILSGPERGVELELTAQETGIVGITNGLDIQDWDPSTDKHLDVNYDITTVVDAKPVLKEILRTELGLPQDNDVPLIGFIGRLEEQKGSDILMAAMPEILKDNVQLIVLGTGKEEMEKQIKALEAKFPTQVRAAVKFDVPLAHLMIAAVSFMVIPSRFEPCGLNQLYCMRYGTIPVVASTGGLVDTVEEGVTGFQTGRSFNVKCEEVDSADVECLVSTIRRALKTYETPAYYEMMKAGMAQDLSWKAPAKRWEEVLVGLTVRGSVAGMDAEEIAPLPKEQVAAP